MAGNKRKQSIIALSRELRKVEKKERSLQNSAMHTREQKWRQALEDKVPDKVYENLQKAFCKAFELVFEKGTVVIEKSYQKEEIQDDHKIQNFAFELKANQKSLKKLRKAAGTSRLINTAFTTVEGIGLGAFGIGLPDIVLFISVLLRGIYEMSLRYGFDYDTAEERLFILKLMEAAMLREDEWVSANHSVDRMLFSFVEKVAGESENGRQEMPEEAGQILDGEELSVLREQIRRTADIFAVDMLLLKFVQGLPVAGIIGGAGNPLYYNKVMKYVEVKYRKRYLLTMRKKQETKSKK